MNDQGKKKIFVIELFQPDALLNRERGEPRLR